MHCLKWVLATISLSVIVGPLPLMAAEPLATTTTRPLSRSGCDVALDVAGNLRTRLFDANAKPLAGCELALVKDQQVIVSGRTGPDGQLVFSGVTGGTYQLQTRNGAWLCRVWTAEAAPPSARPQVVVFESPLVVRGQSYDPAKVTVIEPLLITALLVAAIAVPIAVHDSGGDSPSGS